MPNSSQLEVEDEVFETNDKETESQNDDDLSKEISDIMNNSYNFNISGSSSNSFPSMSMDFTYVPPPMDLTPRLPPPSKNQKQVSKNTVKSTRGELESKSEAATLAFVIDKWKSGFPKSRSSMRQRRKIDILEEDAVRDNNLTMASPIIPRKVVKQWKSLKYNKC